MVMKSRAAWRLTLVCNSVVEVIRNLIFCCTCNFLCCLFAVQHFMYQLLLTQSKVDDHRRKWDRSEFEKLARERLAAEEKEVKSSSSRDVARREPPVKRDLLKPREYKVYVLLFSPNCSG